jgi:hypothetical protein
MLRTSTRQEIADLLDSSYFGGANFNVVVGSSDNAYFSIWFIPNTSFSFHCMKYQSPVWPFQLACSPGTNVLQDERSNFAAIDQLLKEIVPWTERVKEEVVAANPLARDVQRFRQEVETRLNELGSELESFFTKEEAERLNEKLNSLAQKMTVLADENAAFRTSIQGMSETITHLQGALEAVNKGTWFRMATGKLTSWTKAVFASKEAREFALEAAKKLLLEGPK